MLLLVHVVLSTSNFVFLEGWGVLVAEYGRDLCVVFHGCVWCCLIVSRNERMFKQCIRHGYGVSMVVVPGRLVLLGRGKAEIDKDECGVDSIDYGIIEIQC
ncbi:hypothetical protein V6N11_035281 [Hibiscus sabdariffa]|uniref:Uncharacterized protein n=1 Tax=Hibiscus sabdariffa TaxID=183260 RepID=A0ABR2QZW8_9ROSI